MVCATVGCLSLLSLSKCLSAHTGIKAAGSSQPKKQTNKQIKNQMIEEEKTQQKVPHTGIKAAGSSQPKEKQVQKERELLCANVDEAA